ncbi:MAG: ABC transporter ATP-binding protein [Firmicutes bacterium]|nr:ABC transporter ATP-binding protein [Bacillota bacterium]
MSILEVKNLGINFGGLRAVDNFDITIDQHELVGLIGPNGAGKTTVFNMLTGVYQPNDGDILIDGKSILKKKPHEICALGIARTFQNIRLFGDMSVIDNVKVALNSFYQYSVFDALLKDRKYQRQEKDTHKEALELLKVFELDGYADYMASNLPYGKQRELEIVRAMAAHPKLLLLDEPAAGMNPNETINLMKTIRKVRDEFDIAILLIEHDMKLVKGICERVTVLNYGRVLRSGVTDEVLSDPEVIKAYLGE